MYVYVCVYVDMFIFYSSILKMPPVLSHLKMSVLLLFFFQIFWMRTSLKVCIEFGTILLLSFVLRALWL